MNVINVFCLAILTKNKKIEKSPLVFYTCLTDHFL